MKILAIETSCDETGLALITISKTGKIKVLENLVRSQINIHQKYGGVFPTLAKREHKRALPLLWKKIKTSNIDQIAVTQGPGLSPCLWAGITFAEELAEELKIPLIGINHLKGHIYTVYPNEDIKYPVLSLIVSGGHTELVLSKKKGVFKILGRTRDDAAGEAFDKVARLLGLSYPGGPEISRVAEKGNPEKFKLPRPMINSKNLDFSFSGLKTSVVYLVKGMGSNKMPIKLTKNNIADVSASFQKTIVDVLVTKTIKAAKEYNPKTVILGGGVAANKLLRQELKNNLEVRLPNIRLILPDPKLTGDNALMIALAAWYERDKLKPIHPRSTKSRPKKKLKALPNLRIDE